MVSFTYEVEIDDRSIVLECDAHFEFPICNWSKSDAVYMGTEIIGGDPWPMHDMTEAQTNEAIDRWAASQANQAKLEEEAWEALDNLDPTDQ